MYGKQYVSDPRTIGVAKLHKQIEFYVSTEN